jgi:thioredoxin reductase (NADPH)
MYDIIIVGAGPAGLTAALYASRANKSVLVFEGKAYGGQILNASVVENYPGVGNTSGFEIATAMYNQVKERGVEIKYETVLNVTPELEVQTSNGTYKAKAIILATGAQNRKLNLPNEVELIGKGVSYCATCDGNFYKGKDVAVIGGGNTALEDALYLSNICNKVYLVHRRDTFRGEDKYIKEIEEKDNIEVIYNSKVQSINGNDYLESITIVDNESNTRDISISGLFIAVGQEPKNEMFANVVELDEKGYIKTKDDVHTNTEHIYVAGDCRNKDLKQLTTAVSDGSIAATVAIKEMNK